jgi:hypothetical protein
VLFHPASSILCQVVVLESPMSSSWQRLWAHRPIDARMALITALIYSWPLLFMAFRSLSCCSKLSIVNCHGCFASNPLQCVWHQCYVKLHCGFWQEMRLLGTTSF